MLDYNYPCLKDVGFFFFPVGGSKLEDYVRSIESLCPHIANISPRTYYRKGPEAVQALSSILWEYTSKDCLEMLDKFFPKLANPVENGINLLKLIKKK